MPISSPSFWIEASGGSSRQSSVNMKNRLECYLGCRVPALSAFYGLQLENFILTWLLDTWTIFFLTWHIMSLWWPMAASLPNQMWRNMSLKAPCSSWATSIQLRDLSSIVKTFLPLVHQVHIISCNSLTIMKLGKPQPHSTQRRG